MYFCIEMKVCLKFLLDLCFLFSGVHLKRRDGVVRAGTTVGPKFIRIEGKGKVKKCETIKYDSKLELQESTN